LRILDKFIAPNHPQTAIRQDVARSWGDSK
jgi:hypothetical protein